MSIIRRQSFLRYFWKQTTSQHSTQFRLSSSDSNHPDTQFKTIYPPRDDSDIPKISRYDYVPEDKYRFRRRKEGYPMEWVTFLSQTINFSPQSIKNWFHRKCVEDTARKQSNVSERRLLYGNELGAALFILELNGAVRFKNHPGWIRMTENDRKIGKFPVVPDRGTPVHAIDASETPLMFEGMDNLCGLRELETLIFDNCPFFDDNCIDKLCRKSWYSLINLKIKNCPEVSERGLTSLPKLKYLQVLHLSELPKVRRLDRAVKLLSDAMPKCKIIGTENIKS